MSWAADTNILKHLTQLGTPEYAQCQKVVMRLKARGERVTTFSQCAIEFWNYLTRPTDAASPGLGLSVADAEKELRAIEGLFGIHADTPVIYDEWRRLILLHGVRGKQVHDTRIAACAHMHGITHLLTYNVADFARFSAFLTPVHPRDV